MHTINIIYLLSGQFRFRALDQVLQVFLITWNMNMSFISTRLHFAEQRPAVPTDRRSILLHTGSIRFIHQDTIRPQYLRLALRTKPVTCKFVIIWRVGNLGRCAPTRITCPILDQPSDRPIRWRRLHDLIGDRRFWPIIGLIGRVIRAGAHRP